MTVLRIDASIQGTRSASSALADLVTDELAAARPGVSVRTRHLGADPLPAHAWAAALVGAARPEAERSAQEAESVALATSLADELRDVDALVLAFPLYNWGVSQHVKTWIDLVIAGAGAGVPVLEGTPVVLLTTRGGAYGPGTPKEGWEHSIGYLRRVLEDVWGADLTVVERELTLVGVNPAMDGLEEEAELVRKQAEEAAAAAGRALAAR